MTQELGLNKKSTGLVIIDLQKGIVGRETHPYNTKTVIANAAKLADAFRKNGMPVFPVHVVFSGADRLNVETDEGFQGQQGGVQSDWSEFVPELKVSQNDTVITKKQWGAFYGTDLELQLRRRGVYTIVLCGIATNYGVESTARFAYEYGFNQVFAEDAMASMSREMHEASVNYALRRMGRVRKTDEILAALK